MENRKMVREIIIVCFILVLFVFLAIRLFDWQVVNGEYYREKADSNSVYNIKISSARGEILDKNGKSLATNQFSYDLVFCKAYASESKNENDTILKLIKVFDERGLEWEDWLPIIVEDDSYVFEEGRENDIAQMKKDYKISDSASAEECINTLASKRWYNCEDVSLKTDKRNLLSVKYNMNKKGYNYETNYVFAEDINSEIIAIVSENNTKFPGVQIEATAKRKYENGSVAPHVVGYVGSISEEEYNERKDNEQYTINSKIGKTGIEEAMEDYLIGKDGVKTVEVSNDGVVMSETEKEPAISGNTVYLTIDADLQEVALKSLEENVTAAQKSVANQVTGSVAMIDLKDFSVLCAQSYPSYDLGLFTTDGDYYDSIVEDESNPLFARVFEGTYTIGSTMKPAVALACLEEGIINSSTTYNCTHTYQRFAPSYTPVCMGTHGSLNLSRALAVSCNIYFFEAAYNLGITTMNAYQTRFGFGQKTGVEVYERAGVLAGPKERLANGGTWYDGDTVAAAIGQSDNLVTPIQLASYVATIANNGKRLRTHLVSKITDYSRQSTLLENNSSNIEILDRIDAKEENWQTLKEAMRGVVTSSEGTAHTIFGNYGIAVAGKTGTAENTDNSADHETFIAFAPYDDPQVAIAVMIEHGKTGTYPQLVAKAMLDAYFGTENGVKKEATATDTAASSSSTESTVAVANTTNTVNVAYTADTENIEETENTESTENSENTVEDTQ